MIEDCYENGFKRMPMDEYLFELMMTGKLKGSRYMITHQISNDSDIEDSGFGLGNE
jgi:hypothetical protein